MRPATFTASAEQASPARPAGVPVFVRPFVSIQGRMLLMFLLVILMAMLLVSALLLQQLQTYYLNDYTSSLTRYADQVGQAVAGNLAAGSVNSVQNQLNSFGPDPTRSVIVVGPQGQVVGATSAAPGFGTSLRTNKEVSACLGGRTQVQRSVDLTTHEQIVGVTEPILANGRLVGCAWARGNLDRIDQTLASIRMILLRTTAGALALVALITLFLARTITGPLRELTARARELAAGRFDQQIEVRADDELGNLASMFNYLSLRLRETLAVISAEKRRADAILAHMADGIVAADSGGVVSLINPAAARLLGTAPDAVGRPLAKVVPAVVNEAVATGDGGRAVRVDLPERGQVLIARVAELRGDADEPAGWVIVFADATEQERLNAQRRDFVSNVSHELRTPLTAIKSYTESLLDGGLDEPATGRRFLGVILAETDRMVQLIRDLLQLTELEPQRRPWQPRPFRLEDAAGEAVHRVEARVRSKGLALDLQREGATPPAMGDPDRILQVLSNLLENAIDFTPTGGHIRIHVGPAPEGVLCRVADTGVGIPARDLPHVFERLYRVEASRARELGGTGLGLSIAKEIVEAHGGEIWIHSTVGEGTEVGFTLPAAPAEPA